MSSQPDKHRESAFWDRCASTQSAGLSDNDLRQTSWEVDQPACQFYLRALGDLQGKEVLECGCGDGRLSVLLASAGARVYACDISPVSVAVCKRRAAAWGLSERIVAAVADVENLPYPNAAFDVVCGAFILHHVNVLAAGRAIARLLKDGGRAVFWENSATNPVLMLGRKWLAGRFNIPRFSSEGEHPLTQLQVRLLRRFFGQVNCHFPQMLFFTIALQRFVWAVLPTERFPRGPLRQLGKWLWKFGPWLDNMLYCLLPFVRRYSWWQVLVLSDPVRNS